MGEVPFDIHDIKKNTKITSISQLRKFLFRFKIHEQPKFLIRWLSDDELPKHSKSLQLSNSDKYNLSKRYHSF